MSLDIIFAEDIRNALLAANEASAGTAQVMADFGEVELLRAFRVGYKAALSTVALAFGIPPAVVVTGPLVEAGALAPPDTKKGAPL